MSAAAPSAGGVLDVIRERRSWRRFARRGVPDEVVSELLDAGRWAPSADNAQPWYMVVVQAESTRRWLNVVAAESRGLYDLWAASLPRQGRLSTLPDFLEVPLCLAFFADPRQSPAYVEGEQSHILATGMAIQNVWLAAHARGMVGCFWSHLEQDQMKSILGVPHHYYFAGILGLGFQADEVEGGPSVGERKPLAEMVGYDWFKNRSGEAPPADKLALLEQFLFANPDV